MTVIKEISNSKEYKDFFEEEILKNQINKKDVQEKKILAEALKQALDTRKFEIELYWKRTTYFWAFIVSIFIAYFAVLNKNYDNFPELRVMISIVGFLFSIGWYLVNRGSKYWQESWELQV